MVKLGRLEEIKDLRSVWKHEAKEFNSLASKRGKSGTP